MAYYKPETVMKDNLVFKKKDYRIDIKQETQFKEDECTIPGLIALVFKGYTKDEIAIELRLQAVEINAHLRNAFLCLRK